MLRNLRSLVVLFALASAPNARADASITVEGFAGWQHLELRNPAQQVANAINGSEGTAILGGDLLLDLSGLGLGLAVDKTVSGSAQPWAGSIVAGFLPDPRLTFGNGRGCNPQSPCEYGPAPPTICRRQARGPAANPAACRAISPASSARGRCASA